MTDKNQLFVIGSVAGLLLVFAGTVFAGWTAKPLALGGADNVAVVNAAVQNETVRVEKQEFKGENGERKEYELHYKNDVLSESYVKFYDKDNRLILQVINNSQAGTVNSKEYFLSGDIRSERNYKDGQLEGPCRENYDSGKPKFVYQYRIGKKNGLSREYFEDGQLKSEVEYIDDQFSGDYKEFYPGGQLKVKCNYNKATLSGRFQEYYENGKVKVEDWYQGGKRTGVSKQFNDQGVLIWQGPYNNGNLQGKVIEYDNAGKVKSETDYVSGKLHGLKKEFYESGVLKYQAEYVRGDKYGLEQYFSPQGTVTEERTYFRGIDYKFGRYYSRGGLKLEGISPLNPIVIKEHFEGDDRIVFRDTYIRIDELKENEGMDEGDPSAGEMSSEE